MEKNKFIIIALIAVIALLVVAIAAAMPNLSKQDVDLKFKGNSTLTEGDSIEISLTDENGTAIANQTVNVTVKEKNGSSENHSVITNENGSGKLQLDKLAGEYEIILAYGGNDDYNALNATRNITVEEKVVEAQTDYDSGSFYSGQAERVIYTGEVHDGPDGHKWKHTGNNEWVQVD